MADASPTPLDVLTQERDEPTWQSLPELWDAYASERAAGRSPFSAAVRVAARADRLGQAFAAGYPAALEHLVPGVRLPCALCATEVEGNRPRAIATTLEEADAGYRLDGTKTFVTFGTLAKTLIIVACAGIKPDGRPDIVVVHIPADRDGVALEELPPTSFAPEIVHARLTLDRVAVLARERLPGDGYLRYVKPFRTIEDIHVIGAALGYVIGWARRIGASNDLIADLSADLVALDTIRESPALDSRVHIVLHGVLRHVKSALQSDCFEHLLEAAPGDERDRWVRDRALLDVASKARAARFERAQNELWRRADATRA
jgi:acyl-CoA dehydrogenase